MLTPTFTWIENKARSAYIPPALYTHPPEGWLAWAEALTDVASPKAAAISGRMNQRNALAHAQWAAMRLALIADPGRFTDDDLRQVVDDPRKIDVVRRIIDPGAVDAARQTRQAFEDGRPFPVTLLWSVERFTSFVPVVRHRQGRYVAGLGKNERPLAARHHADALGVAASEWYDPPRDSSQGVRGQEIAARRKLADEKARSLPPLYLDTVCLQLEYEGVLTNVRGGLVASVNDAHGNYVAMSERWCYVLDISTAPASRLAILSALEDGARLQLAPDKLPTFAGLDGWQAAGDGFVWERGQAQAIGNHRWRLTCDARPVSVVSLQSDCKALTIHTKNNQRGEKFAVPTRWNVGPETLLAWAMWRAAKAER